MNEVRRVIRLAAWRLWLVDLFRTLAVTTTVAIVALLLARITERVLGVGDRFAPWWQWGFIGAGVLAVVSAVIWSTLRRRKTLKVAVELDERAGLREALSTALCVEKHPDAWAQAMVETAEVNAKRVNVKQAIPFQAPPLWPVPFATGLALLLTWLFLPNFDLSGDTAKKVAAENKAKEVVQVRSELDHREKILKEMLKKANVGFVEDKADLAAAEKKAELNDPEAIKRAAVKQLTDLTTKLEMQKNGEKQAQADAIKEAMKQLKQPQPGPLDEFSKALARGDFNKAKEQLAEVSKQMAEGNMSPDKQELTKKQLEELAKQMEKLAESQQQLEKKLEQQGLDKKSAQEMAKAASTSPEAMEKALEQMKNLSEAQKKKLMDMAKAMSKCEGACENMAKAMSKAAQGMSQEGMSQEGMEGMEQLAKELSESEMLSEDMENLDAALSEAKKQLKDMGELLAGNCEGDSECEGGQGNSQWRQGSSDKAGQGSGGPGQGNGFGPEEEAADYAKEKKKAPVQTGQGPIIGTRLVNGPQVKGESVAEFAAGVAQGTQEMAEAVETQQIPREMQDAVKQYFGRLDAKVKATKPGSAGAAPAPAAGDSKK